MKIYYFAVVLTAFCIAKEAQCKTNEIMSGLLIDDIKDSHWLFIRNLVHSYYGELKSLAAEVGSAKARGCAEEAAQMLLTDLMDFAMKSVADCVKSESDVTEMNECCLKIGRRVFEAGMDVFKSTKKCIDKEAECNTNETMCGLLIDDIKDSHWLFIHTLVLSYYGELKSLATEAGSTNVRGCAVASEILYTDLTKFGMESLADCAKSESDVAEMNECCLKIGRRVFEAGLRIFGSTKKCIDEES